jgi:hypothetical protein
LEFNFSPSGQWAAYAFSDYRQRAQTLDPAGAPKIRIDQNTSCLTLEALLSANALPLAMRWQPLHLGLSAVVENRDGRLSYWALCHPAGTPTPKADFHLRSTFDLVLPMARKAPSFRVGSRARTAKLSFRRLIHRKRMMHLCSDFKPTNSK